MKVAKLKPSYATCRNCLDAQLEFEVVEDCSKCDTNKEVEVVKIDTNFWSGTYAIVIIEGKIEKVAADRLYDIRDV